MSDLRSQLAAAFGQTVEAPEEPAVTAAPSSSLPPLLGDHAHLDSDWMARLRQLRATLPHPPVLSATPKLAQARQVTDHVVKALKKSGRKRDARELVTLRSGFLARRDKAAWAAVKIRFSALGLSTKAYRALKQGSADPVQVLTILERTPDDDLRGMGASRLRELLG